MTEIYYECNVHGMQKVIDIHIKQASRLMRSVAAVYHLECGCNVVNETFENFKTLKGGK